MFKYLEKLREKSESQKKRTAFLFSFLFVGIIFVVWLTAVFPTVLQQKSIDDRVASSGPSPLSTFESVLSQSTSAIGDQVAKLKSIGSVFSGPTDYYTVSSSTEVASTTENNQ